MQRRESLGRLLRGSLAGRSGLCRVRHLQPGPAVPERRRREHGLLASQLALGLGSAAEGDKYHFLFDTVFVSNGATAHGHGFLFVMPGDTAVFVIAGHGDHPLAGQFKLTGEGDITCFNGEGTAGDAMFHLEFPSMGLMDDGAVGLARCESAETCRGDIG